MQRQLFKQENKSTNQIRKTALQLETKRLPGQ